MKPGLSLDETVGAARCLTAVIRRHVLAAVAEGVQAGDDDVARAALGRIDWILRGRARRRLEHALIDAALATGPCDEPGHVLRAAALVVASQRDVDLADRDRVAAAYRALPTVTASRAPLATVVAAAIGFAVAAAVGAAAVGVVVDFGPPGPYTRPARPAPVGAFRDGGVPVRDPAIEHVLADELPQLVVVSDSRRPIDEPERRRRTSELRDHRAFAARPALAAAWRAMIDELGRWVTKDAGMKQLRARVDVVSDQLAAAGLGYYVDAEVVDGGHAGIFSYRIEDVAFVRAADDRVRVLALRRLDHLNISLALLGMKPEQLGDPVVLLDQVEDHVATQIMPVLGGRPYTLSDDGWDGTARGRTATMAAGDAIRRELVVALGTDLESRERGAARIRKLLVASVRHHEAQHAIDALHHRDAPAALSVYVGAASSPFVARARAELSAYTSQIASDPWLPQLALWNLARHGFRSSRTSPEAYAAVVVVEGLARELAIPEPQPIVHDGEIDRDRLGALVAPLAGRTTAELRSAAAALWTELFEQRLARIVDG